MSYERLLYGQQKRCCLISRLLFPSHVRVLGLLVLCCLFFFQLLTAAHPTAGGCLFPAKYCVNDEHLAAYLSGSTGSISVRKARRMLSYLCYLRQTGILDESAGMTSVDAFEAHHRSRYYILSASHVDKL